jgi:hypothetical protein
MKKPGTGPGREMVMEAEAPLFAVCFESMTRSYAEFLVEAYGFAPAGHSPELVIERLCRLIAAETLNFTGDFLRSVTVPADGAGPPRLGLTLSDGFKQHVTRCALREFDVRLA